MEKFFFHFLTYFNPCNNSELRKVIRKRKTMKEFTKPENKCLLIHERTEVQIFLCEDNIHQLQDMANIIKKTAIHNQWNLQVYTFDCAAAMLHALEERRRINEKMPDVVFTDIEMPDVNGIEFGRELCKLAPEVYLIYITAYTEYAISGYETRAYRYLLKPLDEKMVQKVLIQVFREQYNRKYILIEKQGKQTRIALKDIIYLSSQDKYTIIHTAENTFLDRISLQIYEQKLEKMGFFRIHRKYLVNMRHHKMLKNGNMVVSGNQELPISRRKKEEFHTKYVAMLESGMLM